MATDPKHLGVQAAVAAALDMVAPNTTIGLGSGRASLEFVRGLGARVKQGFKIRGVPTSQVTADLATQLGIPLTTLDQAGQLALTVDGADEVDPNLDLIKGLGGALVREKIVEASSDRLIIIAGDEKWVEKLGAHGVLPVEVVPFGTALCTRRLTAMGLNPKPRPGKEGLFITDNHNIILDCQVAPLKDPATLERDILAIPGVVGTGLFLNMAHIVLLYNTTGVRKLKRSKT